MPNPNKTPVRNNAYITKQSSARFAGQRWQAYIRHPGSRQAYVFAAAAVLAISALNTIILLVVPMPPLVLLIPALVLTGLSCGAGPGFAVAAMGALIAWLSPAPAGFPAGLPAKQLVIRAVLFVSISGLVVCITSALRRVLVPASARLKVEAALGEASVGAWELDLLTKMVCASASAHQMFGLQYTGQATHIDSWLSQIVPEDAAAIRKSFHASPQDQTSYLAEYRVPRNDGHDRWIMSRAGVLVSHGRSRLIGALIDVTDRHLAEERFREATALLRTVVETAPARIYAKDRHGRMLLANRPALTVIGRPWQDVEGRTEPEFFADAAQAAAVAAHDGRLMQAGQAEQVEELMGEDRGSPRVWSSAKAPMHDPAGAVVGLVGVSVEITGQKRVEARLRLLVDELDHRLKNTLGVVQGIVLKTLDGSDPATRQALVSRLVGLAAVHDLLTRKQWEGAGLEDVVAVVLAPHGGPNGPRFRISGPKLRLSPKAAQTMSMGLHELATNALKHGALSNAGGAVTIDWIVTDEHVPRLRLTWAEQGGSAVTPPVRNGFGSWLMRRGLPHDLAGTVRLSFDQAGLVCVIEAPLTEITGPEVALPPGAANQASRS